MWFFGLNRARQARMLKKIGPAFGSAFCVFPHGLRVRKRAPT